MRPASIRKQVSSGGIIFRKIAGRIEIILIALKGGKVWCLPKGFVEKGEMPEDAAAREVMEETGLTGRVLRKIGDIYYWYYNKADNTKCRKTVHFYLLEYLSGDTSGHDDEVDDAEWFPFEAALARLTYKGERDIALKAREMLSDKAMSNE